MIAYQAHYCMGLPKGETAPTVTEWIKFPWEKEPFVPLSDEDRDELLAEMAAMNKTLNKKNPE